MTRSRRASTPAPNSTKVLASLAAVGAMFVILAVAGVFGDIGVNSGVSGPPTTAFGNFVPDGQEWEVCSQFELGPLPSGSEAFLQNGRTSGTSPGGDPDDGSASYSIREVARDGGAGQVILLDEIVINQTVPSFPNTISFPFQPPPQIPLIAGPGQNQFFFCVNTDQRTFHIPGWLKNGTTILYRQGNGPWMEAADNEMAYELEFMLGGSPATPTPEGTVTPMPTATPIVTATPGPDLHSRYLPQGGAAPGSGGAVFDTTITGFTEEGAMELEVEIVERSSGERRSLTFFAIPDQEIRALNLSGPITDEFGSSGAFGAVQVFANPRSMAKSGHFAASPMVQAVIFATLPDGRQFGQFFAAQPDENAQQAGEESFLFTTHDPSRYRVNVGLSAVEDGTRVSMTPLESGGAALADPVVFELDAGGSDQVNDIHSRWGLGMTADVMVRVVVETGAAFPYASVLDGRSGVPGTSDPTTILPVTEGARRVVLLEMGRITGLNEFSGSASIYNHGTAPTTVRADFYERGVPGIAETTTFPLGPKAVRSWNDVVGELTGRTGVVGAVVFSKSGGGGAGQFSAIGREFAVYMENTQITGTAGQLMPGLTDDDMLLPGETFHFIGLREQRSAQGRERSHLGVLNLGEGLVTMTVSSFADNGTPEGTIQTTVQPAEQLRINSILDEINPDQDGGLKRIEVQVNGPLHVLAYRVNANGDPVTLQGFRVP